MQARLLLPALLALAWFDARHGWWVPPTEMALLSAATLIGAVLYARAWLRFAAVALCGELLLFRSGVWRRSWVIVKMASLQSVRLASTPLDRSLGLVQLDGDIQGGHGPRALTIACLSRVAAERLRAHIWRHMQNEGPPAGHGH
jgi:uncharacterized membrane protein YdbT with pleckstrin-like domain